MPIIERKDEVIEVSGVALFKKDKIVGQLPAKDSFYLLLNRGKFKSGKFETSIPGDIFPSDRSNASESVPVVLDTITSKKKLKLTDQTVPEFELHIDLDARILEVDAEVDFDNPNEVKKLEKAINQSLTEELKSILAYSQEVNSDIFGLGEQYRSQVRNSRLTHESWHNMYPTAKVNIKVDFKILRSGVFE
jgi:spore germination protein